MNPAFVKGVLALHGGMPVRTAQTPAWPSFTEEEVNAVAEVMRSGRVNYCTGDQGKQFERESPIRAARSTPLRSQMERLRSSLPYAVLVLVPEIMLLPAAALSSLRLAASLCWGQPRFLPTWIATLKTSPSTRFGRS